MPSVIVTFFSPYTNLSAGDSVCTSVFTSVFTGILSIVTGGTGVLLSRVVLISGSVGTGSVWVADVITLSGCMRSKLVSTSAVVLLSISLLLSLALSFGCRVV